VAEVNARLLVRRLLAGVLALLGATLIAFALGVIAPGDPAVQALRQGPFDEPDPLAVLELRHRWGLDRPLPLQYLHWLGRLSRGDLGVSYSTRERVITELGRRLPATLLLAVTATALAAVLGVAGGLVCARWAGGPLDALLRTLSGIVASLPVFLTGMLLIVVFAEQLRALPTSGYGSLAQLVLPALALGLGEAARLLRLTRTQLVDELARDYVRTARAKGLARGRVALRHALPNVLLNVTTAVGLHFGAILGGAAVVETVFAWPGIGRLSVESVFRRDYPVVQGLVVLSAALYIAVNLIVDLLYSVVDPRLRVGGA